MKKDENLRFTLDTIFPRQNLYFKKRVSSSFSDQRFLVLRPSNYINFFSYLFFCKLGKWFYFVVIPSRILVNQDHFHN